MDIVGSVQGDVTVIINGRVVRGQARCINLVDLQIELHGDVMVTINGQDFHHEPTIPPNQCRITATVFGGESDYNVSAYDEQVLNDVDLYVAVPDRFEGERPTLRVHNRATGLSGAAVFFAL